MTRPALLRRRLLAFWLACALVLVQLAAPGHQLGHRHAPAGQPTHLLAAGSTERQSVPPAHEAACSLCLALAHLVALPVLPPLLAAVDHRPPRVQAVVVAACAGCSTPLPGNRDPPANPG